MFDGGNGGLRVRACVCACMCGGHALACFTRADWLPTMERTCMRRTTKDSSVLAALIVGKVNLGTQTALQGVGTGCEFACTLTATRKQLEAKF